MVAVSPDICGDAPVLLPFPHLHALVLAGGSGTRLWPLSREEAPKQMLSIFGSGTLLGDTVARVTRFCEGVTVLTSELLADEVLNHLLADEHLDGDRIELLREPAPRDTAFAIALGAAYLASKDPDAVMLVVPSDHLLEDDEAWEDAVRVAYDSAMGTGSIVTFGVRPTRPETGFGYIAVADDDAAPGRAHKVARFVEKPDLETAQAYLRDGSYLWNSGMFMMRCDAALAQFALDTPVERVDDVSAADIEQIAIAAHELAALPAESWTSDEARGIAMGAARISFDHAILERSESISVVPADLTWNDVGSLHTLDLLGEPDESGNRVLGTAVDVGSHNITSYADGHLVATLGLDDIVIASTPDATLVASKDRVQDVRHVVDALKQTYDAEVERPRTSMRPWGSWTSVFSTPSYAIKEIRVAAGKRLSLQSHTGRSEHWIVTEGEAVVEVGDTADGLQAKTLAKGESTFIPAGTLHRLGNAGAGPLTVIEVSTGEYLGEDDITRYEDDWER